MLGKKIQAAILVEQNSPLVIDEVVLPNSLDYGQVLVKIIYTGICGAQIGEIEGRKGPDNYLPHLLGHEGTGIVEQIGPGVKSVKNGDHVVLHWRPGSGIEATPAQYEWRGKRLNGGWVTTFSEYSVVSENRLTTIPKDFDMKAAAPLGCAVTTGFGVINRNAKVMIGESVVVYGAGGVGLNVIQGAALSSAYPIIAIDLFDHKLDLAKSFGATHVINASSGDPTSAVKEIIGEEGADIVVDNTGNTEVIGRCYELTGAKGRTILVGVPKFGEKTAISTLPLYFGKVLTGSHGGLCEPDKDIPRYIRMAKAGRLKLDDIVTDLFPLSKINEALDKMRSGEVSGRCLIMPHVSQVSKKSSPMLREVSV
jgi:S-(hydroxymethyl)glutathione dehydrogenase/alcohol dehydrogenase